MSTITELIQQEQQRQETTIQLIPSENYVSPAVMEAVGSCLMNKYSEGYPGRRYYEGNEIVDQVERRAQDLAKQLFGVPHVNVQPYSGSPANAAIYLALVKPGAKIMSLQLVSGGHLTHGHPKVTFSGTFYESVQFSADPHSGQIDYAAVVEMARNERPDILMIGSSAYPFQLDFARFGAIADELGAWLVADISHISGLVATGEHNSPVPHAHVMMTTTHKTLRGPRGAMIMVTEKGLAKDAKLAAKIDAAVFPGMQGGPHNNTTAGLAVALEEALQPSFAQYTSQVRKNADALAAALLDQGLRLVGGGTSTHLMLIDLSAWGGGTQLAYALARAGIVANKNTIPGEPNSPFYPSGVRVGTPSVTTRGMKEAQMVQIATWIAQIEREVRQFALPQDTADKAGRKAAIAAARAWADADEQGILAEIRSQVETLCAQFPMYAK